MNSNTSRSRQRGFSLTEVLVATAILVVILVGVLMLYDRANNVFKTGNEAADMQQNVRIAYDRVVSDIRMGGFDYKRGGVLLPGQNAAPWAALRTYSAGTIVTPTVANGHTYRATTAGTSGPTQPAWPTGTGQTVTDNGAAPVMTWQENGGAVYEQPDEQVEYAGATALTIRGNFDYSVNEAGDTDHGRETALETTQFPMVTTDNQEIVTYALVSDQAAAGTAPNNQTVTMFVDMNNGGAPSRRAYPGGVAGGERQVDITGVDLTNNNPPYTLYRFNFANDGSVQRTPLASNIRSLNFFYYGDARATQPIRNAAGVLQPNIGGNGRFDPAVAGSMNLPDRLVRRTIRAIRVRLVGMNSQPDTNYADTSVATGQVVPGSLTAGTGVPTFVADAAVVQPNARPMSNYRRIAVDTVVVPRNLGVAGMAQTFLQPPPPPTITNVCIGYCGIAVVSWDPNTNNPNASYVVMWDRSATGSFSNAFDAGTSNTYALDLTQEDLSLPFYFQVRSFNAGGSVFSTNILSASATNSTKPNPASGLAATGGVSLAPIAGKIRLTWIAPNGNDSGSPSCTPTGSPSVTNYIREIKGFRIYRGTAANFNAGPGTRIVDENASGPTAPTTDGYGNFTWDDTTATCGTQYWYRVRAVEWCFVQANYNTSGSTNSSLSNEYPDNSDNGILGVSGTAGVPQMPVNFQIAPDAPNTPPIGLTASTCVGPPTNTCTVNMSWSRVTQTTPPILPVSIDTYEIERVQYAFDPVTSSYQPTNVNVSLPMNNALTSPAPGSAPPAPDPSTAFFSDTNVPYLDAVTFVRYKYDYRVRAMQVRPWVSGDPCTPGSFTAYKTYPPPCVFTGSVVVQTGASAGNGLTPAFAWVMNAGDTITVTPPAGTTFANTVMDITDPNGTLIVSQTSAASPAVFTWANLTPGTPYAVTFTMTNSPPVTVPPTPPCTEQLVRFIQQEPLPACSLTTFATQASILSQTATNYQLKLDLVNGASEALTIQSLSFEWTPPSRITWNSIKFPSGPGASVAGPGTSGAPFTVSLSPLPVQLASTDATVPANGTQSLLLNFAATVSNPPNVLPDDITFICIRYTRPSVTQLVSGVQQPIVFSCAIKPDPQAGNPTTCR